MNLSSAIFYGLGVVLIAAALCVVLAKDVFRSAIALAGVLVTVAALFAWFNADFLAASQLLVYVGGVLVLMLFVIMLLLSPQSALRLQTNVQAIPAALVATLVAAVLSVNAFTFWKGPAMRGNDHICRAASARAGGRRRAPQVSPRPSCRGSRG